MPVMIMQILKNTCSWKQHLNFKFNNLILNIRPILDTTLFPASSTLHWHRYRPPAQASTHPSIHPSIRRMKVVARRSWSRSGHQLLNFTGTATQQNHIWLFCGQPPKTIDQDTRSGLFSISFRTCVLGGLTKLVVPDPNDDAGPS